MYSDIIEIAVNDCPWQLDFFLIYFILTQTVITVIMLLFSSLGNL